MINEICIAKIGIGGCNAFLLANFDRYQESKRNWYNRAGQWVLCDEPFIEDWDNNKKKQVLKNLKRCLDGGGCVLGVYYKDKLIGFAAIHAKLFGTGDQYLELEYLHISNGYRGRGIGKRLFDEVCRQARLLAGKKLYISANPAEDSIAFYRRVGCVDAEEVNSTIQGNAPYDRQLEYSLL